MGGSWDEPFLIFLEKFLVPVCPIIILYSLSPNFFSEEGTENSGPFRRLSILRSEGLVS